MKPNRLLGTSVLVLSAFIYSFFAILSRTIGDTLPIFYQNWTRSLLAALVLLVIVLFTGSWKTIKKQDYPLLLVRPACGLLSFVCLYKAFSVLSVGLALFLLFGSLAISGFIVGKLYFREQLTPLKYYSLIIALLGIGVIYYDGVNLGVSYFMLLPVISGTVTTIWNVIPKKLAHYSTLQMNFVDFGLFTLLSFILSLVFREAWIPVALNTSWLASLLFAFMFTVTGQLVIIGFKNLDAHVASIIMLSEILFGILMGFIFYQESLSLVTLIGGLLIIAAIVLSELKGINKRGKLQI